MMYNIENVMNNNTKFAPRPPEEDAHVVDLQRAVPIWRTRIATIAMLAVAAWGVVIAGILAVFVFN